MILLTVLLTILFAVQFLTQFNNALHRINTRARIRTGRLSYKDIIQISAKQFNDRQWLYALNYWNHVNYRAPHISGRFYLSSNGRLYKKTRIDNHITVQFYSLNDAIEIIEFYTRHEKTVVSSGSSNNWTIYRPAAAML